MLLWSCDVFFWSSVRNIAVPSTVSAMRLVLEALLLMHLPLLPFTPGLADKLPGCPHAPCKDRQGYKVPREQRVKGLWSLNPALTHPAWAMWTCNLNLFALLEFILILLLFVNISYNYEPFCIAVTSDLLRDNVLSAYLSTQYIAYIMVLSLRP